MSNLITLEIEKLLDYLRAYHVITQIQNAVERVLKFLNDHASQIVTLVKGVVKAVKDSSGRPIEQAIGQIIYFPAYPNAKNVTEDLI